MRKLFLTFVLLALSLTLLAMSERTTVISLGLPSYGTAKLNDEGQIIGFSGPNLALGWSWKNYFKPLVPNAFNPYWDIGTLALLVPYIGIGGDYAIALSNGDMFLIGIEAGLLYAFINLGYVF
ncbi:MAG: hypothetical protein H0Z25_04125 [Kosmotoga sp.]|uniref:hypothetical protein n=1 Tax=Kosmotoga sp. TaxID=1955248 RepID=UPI001D2E066D|nr:hypothetical protein [Kosmotoga sp.]MBO8166386.1 hypothetical protein [Kosmotoga sp.]